MANITSLMLFLLPLIVGAIVILAKSKQPVLWTDKFSNWVNQKKEAADKGDSHLKPLYWGLDKIMGITGKINDDFIRSGVRIALSLYFVVIFIYAALLVIVILAIVIIIALISLLKDRSGSSGGYENITHPRPPNLLQKLDRNQAGKSIIAKFFNQPSIRIDSDFKIYDDVALPVKIGEIDSEGKIYDTRGITRTIVGLIENNGDIFDTRKSIRDKVAFTDESGQIKDYWKFKND